MRPYDPNDQNDPFNSTESWNKIDYKFDGNELNADNLLMKISFDENTVPTYQFFRPNDGRTWQRTSGNEWEEYSFDASEDGNTTDSPILSNPLPINPMTIYKYYKEPLIKADGVYNNSERIKRFFFIRAEGSAIVPLDNYLIAIDTYSKYIFAYAKITKYNPIFGQNLPTEFEAIELWHLKKKFYEYDPIGFITKENNDYKITLYKVYAGDMTTNNAEYVPRYSPNNQSLAGDDADSPGRSPYTPYDPNADMVYP